jgi:hypothetical protein
MALVETRPRSGLTAENPDAASPWGKSATRKRRAVTRLQLLPRLLIPARFRRACELYKAHDACCADSESAFIGTRTRSVLKFQDPGTAAFSGTVGNAETKSAEKRLQALPGPILISAYLSVGTYKARDASPHLKPACLQ